MAGIGGVVVQFKANADQAIRETKKLVRSLDKVGDESQSMGRKMSTAAKVGVAAIAGSAVAAGAALWGMAEAAAEDAASAKRLETNLKNLAGATTAEVAAVEEWITAQLYSKGVTDDELRPALDRLLRSYDDVAGAQAAATLAMDLAAATGKGVVTIAEAIAKAHDGNLGPLRKLGLVTAEEAKKGIDWQKKLADQYAGTAETQASTAQGALDKLKGIWGEMQETLGAELIEPIEEFSTFLATPQGQTWLADLMTDVEGVAGGMAELATQTAAFVAELKKIKDWYDSWPEWLKANPGKGPNWNDPIKKAQEWKRAEDFDRAVTTPDKGRPSGKRVSGGGDVILNYTTTNGSFEDSAAMAIRVKKIATRAGY